MPSRMKHQLWVISVWLFLLAFLPGSQEDKPDRLNRPGRYPDKDEFEVCGRIRDVIPRDSGRFRKILIRNTNSEVSYFDDDSRRMTSRAKSKLDILASLVKQSWRNVRVRVLLAWTDQVSQDTGPTSLHYEGRSLRLTVSDGDRNKLGQLAGLAIKAGFDWVEYTKTSYIRASVVPDVCQTSVDLVFLLDGSGSVGEDNFVKVKEFVKNVVDFFNIGRSGTHIAVVTFESDTHVEFGLTSHYTKSDLKKAIDEIEYRAYLTYTGEALEFVKDRVFNKNAGMRTDPGIPKVLMLLTDGHSNGKAVFSPAKRLHEAGVSIYSVGVGGSVSTSELNEIASDPDKDYVYLLETFNDLSSLVDRLSSVSCSEGSLIKSCDTSVTSVDSGSFKYFRSEVDFVTDNQVIVEVEDIQGVSHLYASAKSRNPGPLDRDSVKNEGNSPRAVSVRLEGSKTVFVAVQGQEDTNKFSLTFWDNLFENNTIRVAEEENRDPRELIELKMKPNTYTLRYSITHGNALKNFRIDETQPKVYTNKKLDYETERQHVLVVVAQDQGNKCHRSRTMVQVDVIDVNDNHPVFDALDYSAEIDENMLRGTLVKQVNATDRDSGANGEVTYRIASGNDGGVFEIDSTGKVTLKGSLDFETQNSYALQIEARDGGSPSLSATVGLRVSVKDVNERPSIICDGTCISSVAENSSPDTTVAKVSASDPDTKRNCALEYLISSDVQDKFYVSSNGEVKTKISLDREVKPQYVFVVTVRDCGLPRFTASVKVTVSLDDVNDNSPRFPGPYAVIIQESEALGSSVVQVKATDADEGVNAEIRYSLSGPDSSAFDIDGTSGRITIKNRLDYETKPSYTFTAIATDQGAGKNTGSTSVTVQLVDINDNRPEFQGTPYRAQVKEESIPGTLVIDVNATDDDSGSGGEVRYSIRSGNTDDAFDIDPNSGHITVKSSLDRETRATYDLVVEATDRGSPSLHSSTTVEITVRDGNDNSPIFQGLPYSTSISENADTGQLVIKVSATDNDDGIFGQVTYTIDSPASDTFEIDSNGNIKLKKKLDYETKKSYTFKVVATDGGKRSSEATVEVLVEDFNDNPPIFKENPYTASVAENAGVGDPVKVVNATDEDSGPRGRVTYSIAAGNNGNAFRISASGAVTVASSLDRETQESYNLTISAKDDGSPSLSATTQMIITIADINDNRPTFSQSSYSFSIAENNLPNATVDSTGPAQDADTGANGEIVYTIVSGNANEAFEFRGDTGDLIAKNTLDREDIASYSLIIEARDKGSPSLFTRVPVDVTVLDRNDNGPRFSENPYNCTISENSAANSPVCFVSATDEDAKDNGAVTYELVVPSTRFSVDQNNGEIKALVPLDREEKPSYTFAVRAKDRGSPSQSAEATVIIQVDDKNDNEPLFNQSDYTFDVREDVDVGKSVGSVFAEDKDEGKNGQVVYSITRGNTNTAFGIDDNSGKISVKSKLDRETLASYKLTVRATDRGSPALFSSRVVSINVKDVNDNDPKFTQSQYTGNIAEDASVGSGVVQVQATDDDEGKNGRIKYSITGGDKKEDFTIDEDSGVISTASLLDYETKKSYLLDVKATDGGSPSRSASATVSITIKNTNDNAPTFEPGLSTVNVSEAVAVGTEIVRFNATDKDGNNLTFSISSGNTGNALEISTDTGVVKTAEKLDRETVPRYNLTVTVTEIGNGGQSTSRNLTVVVLDENDNAPVFVPSSYQANVTENSGAGPVVTVTATDKDEGNNAKVTYSIDPASQTKFIINPETGEISTKSPLDHEENPRYVIQVTAKDSGSPSLSSVATVVVNVEDTNDNSPTFKGNYSTPLPENTASGRLVLRVEATDPDSGANGEIQYDIISGNDDQVFSLDRNNGGITVVKSPDRETNPSFTLTIRASNKVPPTISAPATKTTTTVDITITDVNDNAPEILNTIFNVQVQENSKPATEVVDVNATDKDTGVNSEIKYEIVSGNVNKAFAIDEGTGEVTVKGVLDREVLGSYTLRIRASDKGTPSLFTEKDFNVTVTDLDDNKPEFSSPPYSAFVSEGAKVNTSVITIKATDKDSGPNGKIAFSFESGNDLGHFRIDPDSGEVFTDALLDYETVNSYSFVVTAKDTKHTVQANLQISLVDINDNNPVFNPSLYTSSIPENFQLDKGFLTLNATDEDPFSGLKFTIESGNHGNKFSLDPRNGELSVAAELDRETTDFYNLTIRVTDGGVPQLFDTCFVRIRVTDSNDNAPKMSSTFEKRSLRENTRVGYEVLVVNATDADVGVNAEIRYAIIKGNEAGLFVLHPTSGALTVNGTIDREQSSSFVLEIVARDRGTPSLTSETLRVEIEVEDENDNDPKFRQDVYRQNITENLSAGALVKEVEATDDDLGKNGKVVYSIKSGAFGDFTIENETGIVKTTVPLDRENRSSYTIVLEARDLGNPSKNSTATLLVNVVDANDNAPVFVLSSLRGNVAEERSPGDTIVTVVATDADLGANGEVEYKLTLRGNQSLKIDAKTGEVTTRVPFDYEEQRNHTFKVTAYDKGNPSLSTTADLFIAVLDVDDNCPNFNPKEYNVTIQENKPIGEPIVQVFATDIDTVNEETLAYGIRSGNQGETFRINITSGMITSKNFADRELDDEFNLIVRAGGDFCGVNSTEDLPETSKIELSKSIAYVNIFLNDVNDNPPEFLEESYKYELRDIYAESLLWVNATDKDVGDNARVTFSLEGVERVGNTRTLTVKATDHGVPPLSSNTTVEISGVDCEAMKFAVSPDGHITAKTLCIFEKVGIKNDTGKDPLVGETLTLICIAKGNTVPDYKWFVNDSTQLQGFDTKKSEELTITRLAKSDSGDYHCVASSEAGNIASRRFKLDVKEPAKIVAHPKNTWAEVGKKATLSCRATGDEPIEYLWFKNKKILLSSAGLETGKPDLVFESIFETDQADYYCVVKNNWGEATSKSARLEIYHTDSVVEMGVTINRPRNKSLCQLFNMTLVKDNLEQITNGEMAVVEFEKDPTKVCNVTACSSDPCQNGASCKVNGPSFSCACPVGWKGKYCEQDKDECDSGTVPCRNNGTCKNRVGSYSCDCTQGFSGKDCELAERCNPDPCKSGEQCLLKASDAGYECISEPRTVDMVYKLDKRRRPWQDWMKYDVAIEIENTIADGSSAPVNEGAQARRKRRATKNVDFKACSVSIVNSEYRDPVVKLKIVLACAEAPNKTFVCNALLAQGKVSSCVGDDGEVKAQSPPDSPIINPERVIVVFTMRDSKDEEMEAVTTIQNLNEGGIHEKLEKFGMTDIKLTARVPIPDKTESDSLATGVIVAVALAVSLVLIVAALIAFVFVRTRRKNQKDQSMGSRAILSESSRSNLMGKHAISMKEIRSADARGVNNSLFAKGYEDGEETTDVDNVSFMVENRHLSRKEKKIDQQYMKELNYSPWFHGSVSRSKAEDILDEDVVEGSFLVRAGVDMGEFYISVRAGEDGPKFRHIAVNRRGDNFVAVCGPKSEAIEFGTFGELIDYLQSTPTRFDVGPDLLLKDYIEKK